MKHLEMEKLNDCVRRHIRPEPTDISLKPIPTGKFNTSYFVFADGSEYVLRIAPPHDSVFLFYEVDMMRQEPGIHALLLEETDVPVARVIVYDDSHEIIDRDFIIMTRLPGKPLSESPGVNTDRVLTRVGECLAQVHALTADVHGYIGEHRPMEPQSRWVDAFWVMWRRLIEDVVSTGHYSRAEADYLIALLDKYLPLFDRPIPASLLHMDIWSQNLIVNESGELTGIVDWDRALWGDPEIEFSVLDYCGISRPAFWEGYGSPRERTPEATIRNIFYLLYEIQKYIVIRHGRSNDPAGAQAYKRQTLALANRYLV